MGLYIHLVVYAALGMLVYDFVKSYRAGTGTTWQKLLAAGKGTASILQARVAAMGGLALTGLVDLADMIGNPGVKSFVDQYLGDKGPAVGWTMVACALIAEWARRRTLATTVNITVGK